MEERQRTLLCKVMGVLMLSACVAAVFIAVTAIFSLRVSAASDMTDQEETSYIDARMEYDNCCVADEVFYACKGNPVLRVEASRDMVIYVQIKSEGSWGGWIRNFEENGYFEYEFEEGRYEISVYGKRDGRGDNIYAEGFPVTMVYDNTPPENPVAKITAPGAVKWEDGIFSGESVAIKFDSKDELSGIRTIYVQRPGEAENECDSVVIESGSCGELSIWSEDMCGNLSDKCVYDTAVWVDRERPEISWERKEDKKEGLELEVRFTDELSGLSYAGIYLDDEQVDRFDIKEESGADLPDEKKMTFSLSPEEVGAIPFDSECELRLYCKDRAGNDKNVVLSLEKVDENAPILKLGGIRNGAVTDGYVRLYMDLWDENLPADLRDAVSISVRHTGYVTDRDGGFASEEIYEMDPYEDMFFYEDGRYEVTAKALDLAGNTALDTLDFIIDNTPPLIRGLDDYDGLVTDRFMIGREDTERMFMDASVIRYQMYINGRNYHEGEPVDKSGRYRLEVAAVDQTGNLSRESVRFTVKNESEVEKDGEMAREMPEDKAVINESFDGTIKTEPVAVQEKEPVMMTKPSESQKDQKLLKDKGGEAGKKKEDRRSFIKGCIVVLVAGTAVFFIWKYLRMKKRRSFFLD